MCLVYIYFKEWSLPTVYPKWTWLVRYFAGVLKSSKLFTAIEIKVIAWYCCLNQHCLVVLSSRNHEVPNDMTVWDTWKSQRVNYMNVDWCNGLAIGTRLWVWAPSGDWGNFYTMSHFKCVYLLFGTLGKMVSTLAIFKLPTENRVGLAFNTSNYTLKLWASTQNYHAELVQILGQV